MRTTFFCFFSVTIAAGACAFSNQAHSSDPKAGEAQFKRSCGTCHVLSADGSKRQGPHLDRIIGRKLGSVAGFKYSPGLLTDDRQWTAQLLDRWLENPKQIHKDTIMGYRQRDPDKRRVVIDYLVSLGKQ